MYWSIIKSLELVVWGAFKILMPFVKTEIQLLSRIRSSLCGRWSAAQTVGSYQFFRSQRGIVGSVLKWTECCPFVNYFKFLPDGLEIVKETFNFGVKDLEILLCVFLVTLFLQLFHDCPNIQVFWHCVDFLLKFVEYVCTTGGFMNVFLNLFDPVLKVHVTHVFLDDLWDELTILSSIELGNVRWWAFVLFQLLLEEHDLFLQFSQLFLMQFYLISDLANQVRIQPCHDFGNVFHFLETAFLIIQLSHFILNSYDFLFHLLFLCKIVLSELDKLIIFSSQLVSFVLKLR